MKAWSPSYRHDHAALPIISVPCSPPYTIHSFNFEVVIASFAWCFLVFLPILQQSFFDPKPLRITCLQAPARSFEHFHHTNFHFCTIFSYKHFVLALYATYTISSFRQ